MQNQDVTIYDENSPMFRACRIKSLIKIVVAYNSVAREIKE